MAINQYTTPAISQFQKQYIGLPIPEIAQAGQQLQARQDVAVENLDLLQDALSTAKVDAADRALYNQMGDEFGQRIKTLSEDGYYGDKMRQIRGLAREFNQRYQPFALQKERIDKAKQDIMDLNIDNASKQRRIAAINRKAGLKLDEGTGRIDESSIFGGRKFADRPELTKIVDDAVHGIAANAGESGYTFDPKTGLLISQTGEYVSRDRVQKIAMSAISNDPKAMAFIQDELALKAEEEGRDLTDEEKADVINGVIKDTVGAAISKYSYYKGAYEARNAPDALLGGAGGKPGELEITAPYGDETLLSDITEIPQKVEIYSQQVKDIESKLLESSTIEEQNFLQNALRDSKRKLESAQNTYDRIKEKANVTGDELDLIRESKAGIVPADMNPGKVRAIEKRVEDSIGFGALIPGVMEPPYDYNQKERDYFYKYADYYQKLGAKEREISTKISNAALSISNEDESLAFTGVSMPTGSGTNEVPSKIKTLLEGTPQDIGIQILDENGVMLEGNDVPREVKSFGMIRTSPKDGYFKLRFTGKGDQITDDRENNYEALIPMRNPDGTLNSITELLGRDLLKRAGNQKGDTADDMRVAGANMLFPDLINDINSARSGTLITDFAGKDLVLTDENGKNNRYILRKEGDQVALVNAANTSEILTIYNSAEDASIHLMSVLGR